MYNVTLKRLRITTVAVESNKYSYSECVSVAVVMQHAMRMHRIVICGLSGSTIYEYLRIIS